MGDLSAFNYVDLIFLLIILVSMLIGFLRGFSQEVLGILGWIGAVFAVLYGLPVLRPFSRNLMESPLVADFVTGGFIFVITIITLAYICKKISSQIKGSALGGVDRSLGLIYGVFRGIVFLSIIFLISSSFTKIESWPEVVRTSRLLPLFDNGGEVLVDLLPEDFRPNSIQHLPKNMQTSEELMRSLIERAPESSSKNTSSESKDMTSYNTSQKSKLDQLFALKK